MPASVLPDSVQQGSGSYTEQVVKWYNLHLVGPMLGCFPYITGHSTQKLVPLPRLSPRSCNVLLLLHCLESREVKVLTSV